MPPAPPVPVEVVDDVVAPVDPVAVPVVVAGGDEELQAMKGIATEPSPIARSCREDMVSRKLPNLATAVNDRAIAAEGAASLFRD